MSYEIELKNELRALRAEVAGLKQDTATAGKSMGDALRQSATGTKATRTETDKLRDQVRSLGQEGRKSATILYEGFGVQLKAALLQVNVATMGIQYGMQLVGGVVDGVRTRIEATAKAAREMNGEMQKAVGTRAQQAGAIMKASASGVAPADTQKALKAFAEAGGDTSEAGIKALADALGGTIATGLEPEQFAKLYAAGTSKKGGRLDPERAAAIIYQAANEGAGALKELEGAKPADWRRRDRNLSTTARAEINRAIANLPSDEIARRSEAMSENKRKWKELGDPGAIGFLNRFTSSISSPSPRDLMDVEQIAQLGGDVDLNTITPEKRRTLIMDEFSKRYNTRGIGFDELTDAQYRELWNAAQSRLRNPKAAKQSQGDPAQSIGSTSTMPPPMLQAPTSLAAPPSDLKLPFDQRMTLRYLSGIERAVSNPTRDINATR